MIANALRNLHTDLMEEVCTLEVINDANLGEVSDRGHIDAALNGCVKRLRKLMERADELELKIWAEQAACSGDGAEVSE